MRRLLLASAASLPLLLGASHALAQAIEVVVLDPAGRPVPNTQVRLTNPGTGFDATVAADASGKARFPALATLGAYVASVGSQSAEPVELRANFTRTVTLTVGGIEEVVVQGIRSEARLNLTNAEVSSSFGARELQELPVEARDLSTVLFRLPNVTQATGFFPEAPAVSINGANALFTQYLVDGLDNNENFLGGPKFAAPVGVVREVTVLANSYSAEYGRTANGVVNVTTKGGGNETAGEAFFLWRPGSAIDSEPDFPRRDLSGNAVLEGFKRYQGGASLGGAITPDRTFYFVNAELTRDRKDNRLSVPALGVDETIRGENRFDYYTLRLDHMLSDAWAVTARAHRGDVEIERQGGGLEGGFTFPSAGDVQTRKSLLAAFQARYTGDRLSYVGDLQFSSFDWNYGDAATEGPQAVILDPAERTIGIIGNNGFFFDEEERTWQTRHKAGLDLDGTRLTGGADILRADFSLRGGGNPQGNYTVRLTDPQLSALRAAGRGSALALSDLPRDAQVVAYNVELRPATFGTDQTLYAGWLEAEFDITSDLTARFGVRYDYDDLTELGDGSGDKDNVGPRASFNYRLSEDQVLRGGAGLFHEKLPYAIISDALQRNSDTPAFRRQLQDLIARGRLPAGMDLDRALFNGNASASLDSVPFLGGPTGDQLQAQRDTLSSAERQILNPFGYENPSSFQASLGYQRSVASNWLLDGNLLYSRGYDLVRLVDVNAPAPYAIDPARLVGLTPEQARALVRTQAQADATRPTDPAAYPGGSRAVLISDTGGRSEYQALNLAVTKDRGDDPWGLRLSYTLSRLKNDTDDINFRASNSNEFGDEWAPSLNDRTHTISAVLFLYPLEGLSLSVAGLFQSGQPINYGPDAALFGTTDLNGDGRSFATQYTGNPDRAPGFRRNSGRLPWSEVLDLGVQYRLPVGYGDLELRADVFNVFNATNQGGYVVNATASNQFQVAGQPFVTRSAGPPRTFQFGVRYLF
ncbi:MAG TPA: TonB-dependent receptor [Azospirillaceae bacterium]|nr:TonB-dependent receptor [Azospirillaceae bacterium]